MKTSAKNTNRKKIKNLALAVAAVMAMGGLTAGIAASGPAYAADMQVSAASQNTGYEFGPWGHSHWTDWTTDLSPPADPDGQSGETNPGNTYRIGEREERPGETTTERTKWVSEPPAGDGWQQVGQRTVTVTPERTETVVVSEGHWQRYSWTGGPHAENDPPAFPGPDWKPNVEGDPHGYGRPGAYYRSNENSGNGDWFYLQWVDEVTKEVTHPAVTRTEYRFKRTVTGPTEFRWAVETRTVTPVADDPVADDPVADDPVIDDPVEEGAEAGSPSGRDRGPGSGSPAAPAEGGSEAGSPAAPAERGSGSRSPVTGAGEAGSPVSERTGDRANRQAPGQRDVERQRVPTSVEAGL